MRNIEDSEKKISEKFTRNSTFRLLFSRNRGGKSCNSLVWRRSSLDSALLLLLLLGHGGAAVFGSHNLRHRRTARILHGRNIGKDRTGLCGQLIRQAKDSVVRAFLESSLTKSPAPCMAVRSPDLTRPPLVCAHCSSVLKSVLRWSRGYVLSFESLLEAGMGVWGRIFSFFSHSATEELQSQHKKTTTFLRQIQQKSHNSTSPKSPN